jgi:hypothetical protein
MYSGPDFYFLPDDLAEKVAGEYGGHATWLEGGNWLGTVADVYKEKMIFTEAKVYLTRVTTCEVNISIHMKGVADFVFQNNFLLKDESSEKLLIEGDWLAEWGIIGWMMNNKMIIDVNPFRYAQTLNSQLNLELLVNRYVINVENHPGYYQTVFNLEFEGVHY